MIGKFERNYRLVLISILIATFMISIEVTIVSTAMPQIQGKLGGDITPYSWIFSAFLLAQTSTIMVFGKLADLFGRKPILLFGIFVFLLSSLLCGLAWSMTALIVFRFFQGLAAGSIQPVTQTLVGDMYPGQERARIQGYVAAIYGVSSVVGPLSGAIVVQYVDWAWIFWVNIPIGIFAFLGFMFFLKEERDLDKYKLNFASPILFVSSILSFMFFLNSVADLRAMESIKFFCLFVSFAVAFFGWERRVPQPMLSMEMLLRPSLIGSNFLSFLCGMILIGLVTFLPIYVQIMMGRSPLVAGFTLTAQVFGWTLAAMVAVNLFRKIGQHPTLVLGALFLFLGAVPLVTMQVSSTPFWPGAGALFIGVGLGLVNTTIIVAIQEAVEWNERGVVTALNIFSRNFGSTLGAALLGIIVNIYIVWSGVSNKADIKLVMEGKGQTFKSVYLRVVLDNALHSVFITILLISIICVVVTVLRKNERSSN